MTSRGTAVGAIAFLLATGVLASAQTPGTPPPRPDRKLGRYKLGPVYLTPKLQLKNAGVDSNVFNQRSGAIPDTTVVISPGLAAALPIGRRIRLTGSGFLDLNYFRNRGSERSTDFGGETRAEGDAGPATLFVGGGGGQFRQRFSIDVDERLLRQERFGTAGVTVRRGSRVSTTVSGTSRAYAFEPSPVSGISVQRALDRDERTATAILHVSLTDQTKLVFSGEGIEDRFLKEPRADLQRNRSYRYMGGFEFGERAILRGSLRAGIRVFPVTQGRSPSTFRGLAVAASVSTPLSRAGTLSAIVERDVFYSVSRPTTRDDLVRNTYVSTLVRGQLAVELPFRLIGRTDASLQEAKFLLPVRTGAAIHRRVDHLWTIGGTLLRAFGDSLRVGVGVSWDRRVSSVPERSYERVRFGVQAELTP